MLNLKRINGNVIMQLQSPLSKNCEYGIYYNKRDKSTRYRLNNIAINKITFCNLVPHGNEVIAMFKRFI